jgi:hypothetical protein
MVGVAEIQPQRPVGSKDPPNFVEHRCEMVYEQFGIRFQAELAEPSSAQGTLPGRRELDVGSAVASLDRGGVLHVLG